MNAEERNQERNQKLALIKDEISQHQENYAQSFVEIGRLLLKAKTLFGKHGKWLDWLRENVDMSVCKAQRLMRIADKFPKEAPVPFLEYSKMYLLTALPESEITHFLEAAHNVDGKPKFVQDMSREELQKAVRNKLKSRKEKPSGNEAKADSSTDAASSSAQDSFVARFDSIKKDVSELADLIDEHGEESGDYELLAAELCEICNNIIQRMSDNDGEIA